MKKLLVLPLASALFFEDIHNCVIGYEMGVKLRNVHSFYSLPRAAKKLMEHDISLEVCDSGLPVNQTFVINLDRAPERLAHMKKQMAFLKLPFTRIQAVDGKSIEKYWNEGNALAARGVLEDLRIKWDPMTHTRGFSEAGCGLSHIRTLLRAKDRIEQGEALDGPVLVLEDDVEMSRDLVKDLRENITWLNEKHPNWKLFVVGQCYRQIIDEPAIEIVAEIDDATCTHAYILNGMKAIDEMLDTINIPVYPDPIDYMWVDAMIKDSFQTFVYVPNDIVVQNHSFHSSVQSQGGTDFWKRPKNPIP